jgi:hypothetical protein
MYFNCVVIYYQFENITFKIKIIIISFSFLLLHDIKTCVHREIKDTYVNISMNT